MTLIGRHIGRYRILEQLGQGGMSIVYKGLDTALDREVAVKVLHSHLAGKEESRRRLAREARAVARLHHPNILEVYDFAAEDADQAFIVTEYIRGQTLRQFAEGAGFEPPEIAALVIHDIAAALAQAHEAGVIHRDLKPENVMVRHDGVIKLMDFGIARIIDRDDRMTMTGALVGSPAHMAPEIIEGEEAGPEADIFSLGTMLFYFSTGRLPFSAPNTTATLKRILDGIYDDPRQLVPTVSDDLAEIIATCLARQPDARYPTAAELRDALGAYLSALGLGRTSEELQSFFADPSSFRKALVPRVCAALLERSEQLMAEKRPARALSALNQILAHDPNHARALELLGQMNQARQRQKSSARWRRAGVGATLGVVAVAMFAGGARVVLAGSFEEGDDGHADTIAAPVVVFPALPPVPEPLELPIPADEPTPTAIAAAPDRELKVAEVRAVRPAPAPVPVTIKVLPFGTIEVDGGPKSAEVPQHELRLTPGTHTVRLGCRFCEPVTQTIEVTQRGPNSIYLRAKPLPARLSFAVQPPNAWVRIKDDQRSAGESLSRPFDVRPTNGSSAYRFEVQYEIFLQGHKPITRTVALTPGETKVVSHTLDRME